MFVAIGNHVISEPEAKEFEPIMVNLPAFRHPDMPEVELFLLDGHVRSGALCVADAHMVLSRDEDGLWSCTSCGQIETHWVTKPTPCANCGEADAVAGQDGECDQCYLDIEVEPCDLDTCPVCHPKPYTRPPLLMKQCACERYFTTRREEQALCDECEFTYDMIGEHMGGAHPDSDDPVAFCPMCDSRIAAMEEDLPI